MAKPADLTLPALLAGSSWTLVDGARRWPGGELAAAAARVAGGLAGAGVGPGDRVAWQLPVCADSVLLLAGCWWAGAVAVPIHPRAGAVEVARLVERSRAALAIEPGTGVPDGAPLPRPLAAPGDLAIGLFTAGSSGAPKLVLHRHSALAAKAVEMVDVHGLDHDDVVLMPAPLAHVSGLLNGVLVPAAAGMTSVLMARWDPDEALDLIERERVSFMVGPPTFFSGLLEAATFRADRARSLRLISCGGAGVTPEFVARAGAALTARVKRTYGSTEAPTVTTWREGDPPDRAATTDGRPAGAAAIRIAPDGEIWVRGPELFAGYDDPDQTRAAMTPDGWFRTGDRGRVDADGWLTVEGRLDDVVIRGGENVAAAEVEAVLGRHPAVRAVVVAGYPDDRLGERIGAVVVVDEPLDPDAVRAWFDAQGVARFKAPDRVVAVDALPLLPAGKPDREAARRLLQAQGAAGAAGPERD